MASDSNANSNPSASSSSSTSYFPLPFHLQAHHQQQQPPPPPSYLAPHPAPVVKMPHSFAAPPAAAAAAYAPPVGPSSVAGVYSLPQYHQAQQLFQRDAQTITPEAIESVKAALASSEVDHKTETKKKSIPRKAAGQTWEDPTLADWPENDFRLFCGDLGNEVNDDVLSKAFSRFPSFNMARVIRDKRTGKTKGFGFVSFSTPSDLAAAVKEMNGKYVGNRPIKLRKSTWKERTDSEALEKQKYQSQRKQKPQKKSFLHK